MMNHKSITKYLPLGVVLLGTLAAVLRWALYAFCLDEKYLLPASHPLKWGIWLVTAVALGLIVFAAWKLDGSNKYWDNFQKSTPAAVGHVLAGLGMMLTAGLNEAPLFSTLGSLWKVLGLLSGPCMVLAGIARYQGKRPYFLLHLVPCLFLVIHIINHYQFWSGNPQVQDYVFTIFGLIALMFFCFYTAAFDVGSGRRRMHLAMGLAGVYLGLVSIPGTEYLFLRVGGIAWILTDLCTLDPKPRTKKKKTEKTDEAA